jgi:inner membrane protein
MDSISQLVLGAAVGEAVLGKKLGNKAVLWGAIGGTIPDLDVLASPFLTELAGLTFHRGISHSVLFSVVFSILLGWIISKINKPTSQVSRK